ncbi:MAG: class II fructose-bisphosphate aldolase [Steroidobacterales bacterium]
MLVNLATILAPAVGSDYSVACFNVFGWEDAQAVVNAAAEVGAPVILGVSADFRKLVPLAEIAPMLRAIAARAPVPVCVHLDHTYDIAEVMRAVDAGFSSVMYDGSQLPLDQNIAGTWRVARYAHTAGCSVEAEIGSVPYAEGRAHIKSELTDVRDAVRLAAESGLDAMAVSIGNIHRLKEPAAVIDFKRLEEIEAAVTVPLVIHGTSGIFEHDIVRLARKRSVAKFNIATVLRQAFGRGLRETLARNPERFDRVEIMSDVMPVMSREASRMIGLLGWRA